MRASAISVVLFMIDFVISSPVLAHTGHGQKGWEFSLIHYLLEPVHCVFGLALAGCIVLVILWFNRTKKRMFPDAREE